MRNYSLTHVRDDVLLRNTNALIAEERGTMAFLLAHLAEIDARKLYAPLGCSSMFVYCVQKLRFSEDAAYKRIQAARIARRFPMLFMELAEGRLHLTAVCLLAPYLTETNAEELVRAATHRRKSEVEDLLALCFQPARFSGAGGQTELAPEQVESGSDEPALEQVQGCDAEPTGLTDVPLAPEQVQGGEAGLRAEGQLAPEQVGLTKRQLAPEHVGTGSLLSQVAQLVPLMVRPEIRDRLRYLQALMSHAVPTGDSSTVLGRAIELMIDHVEKRRFGTGNGTRRRRVGARNRYIPADVRHAVWNRDEGRCTFVGENGHRCGSDMHLEFDHVDPRNREDTVEGLRLRCRTHNQHEAERVFGTEFMARKREEARVAAERRRAEKAAGTGIAPSQVKRFTSGTD